MSDEETLKKAMGRFHTRVALLRMGVPMRPHPVTDAEYERAIEYCKCSFTDDDGTVVPGEPCPIHDQRR